MIRATIVRVLAAVLVVPVAVASPLPADPVTASSGLGAGGEFHPLTPQRIYDSRPGLAVNEPAPAPKPGVGVFDIPLLGQGGLPADASDVLGVIVNITVTSPTGAGWLNAYGSGAAPAAPTSILNFRAGETVPNLAIVRPGAGGRLSIQLNASGTAHVIVDVFGWFSTSSHSTRGARLVAVAPGRVLDTRDGTGTGGSTAPLGQGATVAVPVRGATIGQTVIPSSSDVVGVVMNVTGVSPTTPTFVSALPESPSGAVGTSNLNLVPAQVKPNLVVVPVGADGAVRLYNHSGQVHLVADVVAYLERRPDTTRAGRVVPLASPFRVFDTREAAFGAASLGPGQAEEWSFVDFVASVNIGGVPVGAQSALIGNLTSASLTRQYPSQREASYLSVYPDELPVGTAPSTSNLNTVDDRSGGGPVPNLAIVKYSAETSAWVYNFRGLAHYVLDASAVVLAD